MQPLNRENSEWPEKHLSKGQSGPKNLGFVTVTVARGAEDRVLFFVNLEYVAFVLGKWHFVERFLVSANPVGRGVLKK